MSQVEHRKTHEHLDFTPIDDLSDYLFSYKIQNDYHL